MTFKDLRNQRQKTRTHHFGAGRPCIDMAMGTALVAAVPEIDLQSRELSALQGWKNALKDSHRLQAVKDDSSRKNAASVEKRMPQLLSGRSIVRATFRELAEPSDVLLWAIRHERVNPKGVLWVGDALQTPIGMAGAIHFSMTAIDKNNAIGLTAPGTEVLQQVEETAITPPP